VWFIRRDSCAASPSVSIRNQVLPFGVLPPGGKDRGGFRIIIVAASNADPYPEQDAAIAAAGLQSQYEIRSRE
jgi:hypothetical protein